MTQHITMLRAARRPDAEAAIDLSQRREWHANIGQWSPAGLAALQIGARGSTGYFAGYGNLVAADEGEASAMRRVRGAITAANPVPDITRVRNRGDDGYVATHLFEAEPPEFALEFESFDIETESFLTGSDVAAIGEWDIAGRGQGIPILQDTIVLAARQAESEEAGQTGNGYDNLLILSSKFRPTPGDFAWQAVGTQVLNGAADRTTLLPWGATITSLIGQSDAMTLEWFSEYPCTMVCFIGDGTTVAIPTTYSPITVAKTKFWNFATGAALTVSSVNAGAQTATVSAAPAAGAIIVGLLEVSDL